MPTPVQHAEALLGAIETLSGGCLRHLIEEKKVAPLLRNSLIPGLISRDKRCIITPMKALLITMKVTKKALQMLRLIAAYTGEKQYVVLERLLETELRKVEKGRS